jgi:hypothetical protein
MDKEKLALITHTVEGYEVKNLNYKKIDNIITGQVKDPYTLFPHLYDGWSSCVWATNGSAIKLNKGRKELKLKM